MIGVVSLIAGQTWKDRHAGRRQGSQGLHQHMFVAATAQQPGLLSRHSLLEVWVVARVLSMCRSQGGAVMDIPPHALEVLAPVRGCLRHLHPDTITGQHLATMVMCGDCRASCLRNQTMSSIFLRNTRWSALNLRDSTQRVHWRWTQASSPH
jgi:hypothetical protein